MSNQIRFVRRTPAAPASPREESQERREFRQKVEDHMNGWADDEVNKDPANVFFLEDPLDTKWRQPIPLKVDFRDQYLTLKLVDDFTNMAPYLVPNINIRSGKFRVDLTELKFISVVELIPNEETMFDIWLKGQKMPVRIIALTEESRSTLEYDLWSDEFYTLEGVMNLEQVVGPKAYKSIKAGYENKGLRFPWFYAPVSNELEDKLSLSAPYKQDTMNHIIKLVRQQYPNKPKDD